MAFETTTDQVIEGVDLSGRTALVTGATTGLGLETARALAAAGARVVIGARTDEKARAAIDHISGEVPDAALDAATFDLADLDTVRAAADDLAGRFDSLSLLVNNAGIMFTPEMRTAQGFEAQFGTNHLGHFVLTNRLLPLLRSGAPSRVVNLSSGGHTISDILWDDPNFESTPYDKFVSYGQAKTANVLFSVELDRREAANGVRSNAVHPGMIQTELSRHMEGPDFEELAARAKRNASAGSSSGMPSFKSIPQGAATSVWAAVASELEGVGGRYLEDAGISEKARPYALDADSASRLWALSEDLVGENFS